MNQNDFANYRALAEVCRRVRRENDRLKEMLGVQTQSAREFDAENEDVFALVRMNRARMQA